MKRALHLGISTCPNDTFAFHALLEGEVDPEGFAWHIELFDVQQLNRDFAAGRFDAAKLSFAAMLPLAEDLVVLPCGSALGFGVGPVLLARADAPAPQAPFAPHVRVLTPGANTTAHLLWRLFRGGEGRVEQRVFHAIPPALLRAEAELGLCIHEARFTHAQMGLALVEDLGARWEACTGLPLPLGGIAARRDLGQEALERAARAVRASLEWARAHPTRALRSMRRYAQEQADEVLWQHVELYVNAHTLELGPLGARALAALGTYAHIAGESVAGSLRVLGQEPVPYRARLFHLAPRAAWEDFVRSNRTHYVPLGFERESFTHLSHAPQLAGTLARHFPRAEDSLLLLELDRARLDAELRLVPAPGRAGALFPHLFGPLPRAAVLRASALRAGASDAELSRLLDPAP